jgi:hypothetical protein
MWELINIPTFIIVQRIEKIVKPMSSQQVLKVTKRKVKERKVTERERKVTERKRKLHRRFLIKCIDQRAAELVVLQVSIYI